VSFAIHSLEWKLGQEIPAQFTCDGDNSSPPLSWNSPPAGAESFNLVLEDPDAPGGTFIHWVLYDLPASARDLAASVPQQGDLPNGARQGRNDFGKLGYGGPCPPPGRAHRYYFRLYALDRKTGLGAGASRADLERVMRGHVLARAEFMGRYKRR
jgi:Raf kinase inhibitor-like YbhB/YbcL family protein